MEFVPLLFAAFLIKQVVSLVKRVSARRFREAATMLIGFAAGIGIAFLLASANVASAVKFGDLALSSLNGASVTLLGLELAAVAMFGVDYLKARDDSQSQAEPKLLEGVEVQPTGP